MKVVEEEGVRRSVVKRAVAAFAVVEGFEIVEDGSGGGGFGREGRWVIEEFVFEGGEGAFCKGIAVAVTSGAHALAQVLTGEQLAGWECGVLATAIGMEEGAGLDDPGVQSPVQRAGGHLGMQGSRRASSRRWRG